MIKRVLRFARSEDGASTYWNLLWFTTFLIFAGIGVDSSNAYRVKNLLQTTADASAHAGVISLPNETQALSMAKAFAGVNMPASEHGTPVTDDNIIFGHIDEETGIFTPKAETTKGVNAIRVMAERTEEQANELATQILGIVGLDYWNIDAQATALSKVDPCLRDGIVALDSINMSSGNAALRDVCFHGEGIAADYAVDVQQNNEWECGVIVSMPSVVVDLSGPDSDAFSSEAGWATCPDGVEDGYVPPPYPDGTSNPGMYEALRSYSIPSLELELCNQINIVLSYAGTETDEPMRFLDADGGGVNDCRTSDFDEADPRRMRPDWLAKEKVGDPKFIQEKAFQDLVDTGTLKTGELYYVDCGGGGNKTIDLQGVIENVGIITNCQFSGKKVKQNGELVDDTSAKDLVLSNALLMSTAVGGGKNPRDKATIQFPSNAQIGTAACGAADGGVRIYGMASVKFPADGLYNGAQFVTEGSVKMSAQQDGYNGINVLAGDNVDYTSAGRMGICPAENGSAAITTRRSSLVN